MFLVELSQFGFITSLIYIIYVVFNMAFKAYGRFKLNAETRFVMSYGEKILLLLSLAYLFTYII